MDALLNGSSLEVSGGSASARPSWLARLVRFFAPATMVSVGYMDPGNWATDLEGGARFGHRLLWVLVVSNAMALLLQTSSARLGIVSGLDLAKACRVHHTKRMSVAFWLLAELAIIACDLAEVIGSAIALNLLFHVPIVFGAVLTVLDVFVLLALQRRGTRTIDAVITTLVVAIAVCLVVDLALAHPTARAVAGGLVPRIRAPELYVAIGMLGATLMPHNLYLHSALVRRTEPATAPEVKRRVRSTFVATAIALNLALVVNAAILLMAATAFGARGIVVVDLRDAYHLLSPTVGAAAASVLFALGLLCSGQSATITGTLAGQIVMEGFIDVRLSPVARRFLTRGLAAIPAVIVLAIVGETATMPLLLASQVVLSLQLPFAIVPLLRLTRSRVVMGEHATGRWTTAGSVACALLVIAANAALLVHLVVEWRHDSPLLALTVGGLAVLAAVFLVFVARAPIRPQLGLMSLSSVPPA